MKAGNFLLDSSIVIALFKQEKAIIERIKNAQAVFLPAIVLGELYYGAYKSTRLNKHLQEVENLAQAIDILECGTATAKIYGNIKNELKRKGKPIPENDIWIAAIALENNLILANNDHHFDWIEGLKQEKW